MITIERITLENASAFKAIRLRSLLDSPTAFGSTFATESQLPDTVWLERAAHLANEACIGLLAMDAQAACGIVRGTPDEQDPTIVWMASMWVAPSHRRTGIGRLLVNEIVAWGRRRGFFDLKLAVTSNNEQAIRFYQRSGFFLTGRTEPYPNDPELVEYEMLLPLS